MNYYKHFKKSLKKFEEINNSKEYLAHLDSKKKDWKKYDEEQLKTNPQRKDYFEFEDVSLVKYYLYDFLTNDDLIKAIDKLKSLPDDLYDVDCKFKKSTRTVKYNYVQLEYSHRSESLFADICFKKDKFINYIRINCTQINNYYMMLEYEIVLYHAFNTDEAIKEFLYSNIKKINKNDYFTFFNYKNDTPLLYIGIDGFKKKMMKTVMQHYVTTLSFSPNAKYYELYSLAVYSREKSFDINTFRFEMMCKYYYNKNENYIIETSIGDSNEFSMLCGDNKAFRSPMFDIMGSYGNEAYYLLFGYQDLKMFENKYTSVLQGTKKTLLNDEIMSLLTKVQSISDYKIDNKKMFIEYITSNWEVFYNEEKEEIDFSSSSVSFYRKIYSQNLEHLKLKADINNTKSNNKLSKWALIVAIISIVISIFLGMLQYFTSNKNDDKTSNENPVVDNYPIEG